MAELKRCPECGGIEQTLGGLPAVGDIGLVMAFV